jgi:hypothetical protein
LTALRPDQCIEASGFTHRIFQRSQELSRHDTSHIQDVGGYAIFGAISFLLGGILLTRRLAKPSTKEATDLHTRSARIVWLGTMAKALIVSLQVILIGPVYFDKDTFSVSDIARPDRQRANRGSSGQARRAGSRKERFGGQSCKQQ